MTEILADLFHHSTKDEIGKICYLLQGRVAPLYEAIEFGMADKMMIKVLANAYNKSISEITKLFKKEGDLGGVGQLLNIKREAHIPAMMADKQKFGVGEVYGILYKLALTMGMGSVDKKVSLLTLLLQNLDSLSVRYVVRIPLSKLRLGFSDMTILDALSVMLSKNKKDRKQIEAAYNVRPDMGFIAEQVKEKGLKGVQKITPVVGIPILMTRAERLGSTEEIIEKIGKCGVEYKYDGFRLQVHYSKLKILNSKYQTNNQNEKLFREEEPKEYVRLFSRNLEDVTNMYPDIVKGVFEQIKVRDAIFEGEALAYNPKTKEFLPFQETVQRKRKYDIAQKAIDIPLRLMVFELLYVNGESLLKKPYLTRRRKLEEILA